jgi:hypothetical protein
MSGGAEAQACSIRTAGWIRACHVLAGFQVGAGQNTTTGYEVRDEGWD